MKIYKVWARIEVMDTETEEHEELDPELCEYKIGEFGTHVEVANFIEDLSPFPQGNILEEIETAMHELIELGRW